MMFNKRYSKFVINENQITFSFERNVDTRLQYDFKNF